MEFGESLGHTADKGWTGVAQSVCIASHLLQHDGRRQNRTSFSILVRHCFVHFLDAPKPGLLRVIMAWREWGGGNVVAGMGGGFDLPNSLSLFTYI